MNKYKHSYDKKLTMNERAFSFLKKDSLAKIDRQSKLHTLI